jgi:hypothetical protein
MSRLTRVIAPLLTRAGLDVRAISGIDGQVRELIITNPRQPTWGRVVIDREGLMEWDYWGQVADDPGAADIATVIIAILAPHASGHPAQPRTVSTQPPVPGREPTGETR